jgi:hypothetical protein
LQFSSLQFSQTPKLLDQSFVYPNLYASLTYHALLFKWW